MYVDLALDSYDYYLAFFGNLFGYMLVVKKPAPLKSHNYGCTSVDKAYSVIFHIMHQPVLLCNVLQASRNKTIQWGWNLNVKLILLL